MATFEITIDDEKIQELLHGDRGMAALIKPILNQILQAEMTEHLGAGPEERTDIKQAEVIDRLDRRDSSSGEPETSQLKSEIRSRYEEISEKEKRELRGHLSESQTESLEEALRGGDSEKPASTIPSEDNEGSGQENSDQEDGDQEDGGQEDGGIERDRGYGGFSY